MASFKPFKIKKVIDKVGFAVINDYSISKITVNTNKKDIVEMMKKDIIEVIVAVGYKGTVAILDADDPGFLAYCSEGEGQYELEEYCNDIIDIPGGIFKCRIMMKTIFNQYNEDCDNDLTCVGDFEDLIGLMVED